MRYFILLMLLVLPFSVSAKIYKWTDSQGNVHYGDKPRSGAQRIKLPPMQSYTSEVPIDTSSEVKQETEVVEGEIEYKVSITQPEEQATIRNNHGSLAVSVNTKPSLDRSHRVVVMLDGQRVGDPQRSTAFTLQGIFRGKHQVAVEVIDSNKAVVGSSEAVTFYMHRPRVDMVPAPAPLTKLGPSTGMQIVTFLADLILPPVSPGNPVS